jgi:uncharacterized protein YegL
VSSTQSQANKKVKQSNWAKWKAKKVAEGTYVDKRRNKGPTFTTPIVPNPQPVIPQAVTPAPTNLGSVLLGQQPATQVTHVYFVVDESGSMSSHCQGATDTFRQMVDTLKANSVGQQVDMTVIRFGSRVNTGPTKPLDQVIGESFSCGLGMTALNDAIMAAINAGDSLRDINQPNVAALVVILTDGGENESHLYRDKAFVGNAIREHQKRGNWTFVISCPLGTKNSIHSQYEIPLDNIQEWNTSDTRGTVAVATAHVASIGNYMGQRATGVRSVGKYFINVGRLDPHEVIRQLLPLRNGRFRKITVERADKIQAIVESKGLTFEPGRAFYQLLKPEDVQENKVIILSKKDDPRTFYGGPNVRSVLGLSPTGTQKVVPGNLGEWDIWVQSTSNNRNFVAGNVIHYDMDPTVATI